MSNRFRLWTAILLVGVVTSTSMPAGRLLAAAQADAGKASMRERLNRVGTDVFTRPERINDAIRELKDILALDPRSAEAHVLLGIAYRTLASPELLGEAKAELVQALELDPGNVPARFYLASLYLELGRAAKAREEMETALAQLPGRPQFLALLGEAERQLKNPRRAVELTRQALQADESFAQARYYLALALYDLGQRDDAIQELERVVASHPTVVEPYLSLGTVYIDAGRLDDALATLRLGTRIDASRPDLRIQLARTYRLKGMLPTADEQLRLAMPAGAAAPASTFAQQQVDSDLYLEQGFLRLRQGRLVAAARAFEKVLDMDPNHGPATCQLAVVYLLQGSYAKSSEFAARAEKLGSPLPEDKRKLLEEKLRGKGTTGRR